jgi:hypothetical protein
MRWLQGIRFSANTRLRHRWGREIEARTISSGRIDSQACA